MHPLLESPRRLLLYLAAWLPLIALLMYVMWAAGGLTWLDCAAVLGPTCLVYAFACLSPWYICGTMPLVPGNWFGIAMTFAGASVACSLVLVGGAWLTASALAQAHRLEGLEQRLHGHLALLFGMACCCICCRRACIARHSRWRRRIGRSVVRWKRERWRARRNCRRCASN